MTVREGRLYCVGYVPAILFSREGGSPVWVPAFAGKHSALGSERGTYQLVPTFTPRLGVRQIGARVFIRLMPDRVRHDGVTV